MYKYFVPPQEFLDEIIHSEKETFGRHLYYLRKDRAIGKLFEEYNFFWEEWVYDVVKEFYEPGKDMIDIGAHIGTQTICMERVISENGGVERDEHVYSFEPIYHEILRRNINSNITHVYPYGIGEKMSEYSIMIHPWNSEEEINYGATTLNPSLCDPEKVNLYYGSYGPIEITVLPLDIIQLPHAISCVKIDTEGMEEEVLSGMRTIIIRDTPVIIIEIWKHRLNTFFTSEIGCFILEHYNVYQPNSKVFSQCVVCDEDYIFVPKKKQQVSDKLIQTNIDQHLNQNWMMKINMEEMKNKDEIMETDQKMNDNKKNSTQQENQLNEQHSEN